MPIQANRVVTPAKLEEVITGEEAERLRAVFAKSDETFLPFERNIRFYGRNLGQLTKKYPDRWIAIQDERVVGFNKNDNELRRKLRLRGINPQKCVIRFMATKRRTLILVKT